MKIHLLLPKYAFLYIVFILTMLSAYLMYPCTIFHLRFVSIEHGIIENITIIFYFIAIILFILFFLRKFQLLFLHHLIFTGFLLARELDCHKSLTNFNVLKIKFYFASDISILTRLSSFVIMFAFAFYGLYYLKKYIPQLWKNRKENYSYTLFSIIAIVAFVRLVETTKTIIRKIYDVDRLHYGNLIPQYVEECFEMMIPALICLAILQFTLTKNKD